MTVQYTCGNCRGVVEPDATTCPHCGVTLRLQARPTSATTGPRLVSRALLWTFVAGIVVRLVVIYGLSLLIARTPGGQDVLQWINGLIRAAIGAAYVWLAVRFVGQRPLGWSVVGGALAAILVGLVAVGVDTVVWTLSQDSGTLVFLAANIVRAVVFGTVLGGVGGLLMALLLSRRRAA